MSRAPILPSRDDIKARVTARLKHFGLSPDERKESQFIDYLCLLAKWNTTINLTSLNLSEMGDAAIDRLIVEPAKAASFLKQRVELCVDLGSGGGSPAIPLRIAGPIDQLVMVESKSRKCAFLRDVTRQLQLENTDVQNERFEALKDRISLAGKADLISFRAVRADPALWSVVTTLLAPEGRVFWFGSAATQEVPVGIEVESAHELVPASGSAGASILTIATRRGHSQ